MEVLGEGGRESYQQDGGRRGAVWYNSELHRWYIFDGPRSHYYIDMYVQSDAVAPPPTGWQVNDGVGTGPPPTLALTSGAAPKPA